MCDLKIIPKARTKILSEHLFQLIRLTKSEEIPLDLSITPYVALITR